jgi:hypothetical protein
MEEALQLQAEEAELSQDRCIAESTSSIPIRICTA